MNTKKEKKHYLIAYFVICLLIIGIFINMVGLYSYEKDSDLKIDNNYNKIKVDKICNNILLTLTKNSGETINGDSKWETYKTPANIKDIGLKIDKNLNQSSINFIDDFGCLFEGTKIKISNFFQKNIEDIKIGDEILTYNIKNEEFVYSKVVSVHSYIADGIYSINNGAIKITDDHPILSKNNDGKKIWCSINPSKSEFYYNYRDVNELKKGFSIFSIKDGWIKINSIDFVSFKAKVFGLEVENENHNFIANDIVVSNGYYTMKGYVEGVQSLDTDNYIVLSGDKILAFGELGYDLLRDLLKVPDEYDFKITISYNSGKYISEVAPLGLDYSYSDYYAYQKQNILVLPPGSKGLDNLYYGYILVEVFYV